MKEKLINLLVYLSDRMKEQSTWHALAVLTCASSSHFAFLNDVGTTALIAVITSNIIRILLPDVGTKSPSQGTQP